MSRKSSWWLRPQRKGASNRAALNESKYFMEHNKVLRERIKELADENAKLKEERDGFKALSELKDAQLNNVLGSVKMLKSENAKMRELLQDVAICASGNYCYGCPHQYDGCDRDERLMAEGIEVAE